MSDSILPDISWDDIPLMRYRRTTRKSIAGFKVHLMPNESIFGRRQNNFLNLNIIFSSIPLINFN